MRIIRVHMETPFAGINPVEDIEVENDATAEQIEAEAREVFFNTFSYGYEEISVEEEE